MAVPEGTLAGGNRLQRRLVALGWDAGRYLVLIGFLLIFVIPLVWVWSSALKSSIEISRDPFALPEEFLWENLRRAWSIGGFDRYIGNTLIYCAAIVTGVVFLSCMAGYALALLPLPGRGVILTLFLLGLMVPFQSVMIPIYYLLRDIGLLETYWAFIVPGIALRLPFGIFLMRGFFKGLPNDIADAARLDGANEWDVFRQIMLPLSIPGIVAAGLFVFIASWNNFIFAFMFTSGEDVRTLPVVTRFFVQGEADFHWGIIMASAVMTTLPVAILFLFFQRYLIRGLTDGSVKG